MASPAGSTTWKTCCVPSASWSCSAPAGWRCPNWSASPPISAPYAVPPDPIEHQRGNPMANVYYEKDADRSLIADRKVAVIGYGSQGHAHALNLKDSGIDVRVGLRDGSSSKAKAEAAGLTVRSIADAVAEADLVMLLGPDTEHKAIFSQHIAPHLAD